VAYADKRARQRIVSLDDRFASWRRRHGGWEGDAAVEVRRRAGKLEEIVCDAAGIRPEAVGRLRWTAAALRAAAAR
jgi:hypothetical protein